MRRKKIYLRTSALLVLIMLSTGTFAKDYILHSPDHRVSVTIGISDSIGFNVIMDGKSIVKQAKIAFLTDMSADKRLKVRKVSRSSVNTVLHPVVSQKASMIADIYNQLRIDFSDRISLEWRAYDNGVSWRWLSNIRVNIRSRMKLPNLCSIRKMLFGIREKKVFIQVMNQSLRNVL